MSLPLNQNWLFHEFQCVCFFQEPVTSGCPGEVRASGQMDFSKRKGRGSEVMVELARPMESSSLTERN